MGEQREVSQVMYLRPPEAVIGSVLQTGPALAVVHNLGMNQQMETFFKISSSPSVMLTK